MKPSPRLRRAAVVAGIGLYASRLTAESSLVSLSWHIIVLQLAVALGLGLCVCEVARRRRITLSPLLALYAYIIWPWPSCAVAAGAGTVAVLGTVFVNLPEPLIPRWATFGDFAIGGLGFALFARTLSPTVLPADAGEFQLVSHVLGIAHPPGYPLYTMLGYLFTRLPIGDPAFRVSLFAAVTSSLTLAVVSRTVRKTSGSFWAGLGAAAMLAGSTTFWAQSTTANIRSMTALFTALSILTLSDFIRDRSDRSLARFAFCVGLGVTHHSSLVLLALPFAASLVVADRGLLSSPKRWLRPLGTFAAPFALLLYLPIRSLLGAPFDPAPIRTLGDFLQHVLALGFRGDMFYFTSRQALSLRADIAIDILSLQFGWALLWLSVATFLVLLVRSRKMALLLGGVFAVNVLSSLTYRAPQTVEYLMPAYVSLVIISACGLVEAMKLLPKRPSLRALAISLLLVLAGTNLSSNYPSFVALSNDRSARDYAATILEYAPDHAVILSNWHHVTTFWYLQQVEGLRPDVSVRYVYPEGNVSMADNTIHRIAAEIHDRSVIVTDRYHEYSGTSYRFVPFHGACLVQSGPQLAPSQQLAQLGSVMEDRIRLIGYHIDQHTLSPGDVLTVLVQWQPLMQLDRDYSFFVQVLGPEGVLGQGDITHQAARYQPGEILTDEYQIPLLMSTRPGDYRLVTGVYFTKPEGGWQRLTTPEGNDHVALPGVRVQESQSPPASTRPMRRLYSNGLTLIGADVDESVPGSRRLYLHWRTPEGLEGEPRIAIHGDGAALASGQLRHSSQAGYVTTAYDLPLTPERLSIELSSEDSGEAVALLGPWGIPSGTRLTLRRWPSGTRYVPLGGEMVLTDSGTGGGDPVRGTDYLVRPTFLSQRAITRDYRMSLSLYAQSGSRLAQQDSVPAMGAIPTLKWVRGWSVTDPHVLEIPADASGQATLRMTVYDAFTQRPLAVLDDRLVRAGQGVHLDLASVQVESEAR